MFVYKWLDTCISVCVCATKSDQIKSICDCILICMWQHTIQSIALYYFWLRIKKDSDKQRYQGLKKSCWLITSILVNTHRRQCIGAYTCIILAWKTKHLLLPPPLSSPQYGWHWPWWPRHNHSFIRLVLLLLNDYTAHGVPFIVA